MEEDHDGGGNPVEAARHQAARAAPGGLIDVRLSHRYLRRPLGAVGFFRFVTLFPLIRGVMPGPGIPYKRVRALIFGFEMRMQRVLSEMTAKHFQGIP